MCITDKAKETSSCADLFRCGAASVCLDCRMFALCLGASVSLIRLPRCYYYTTCKWCMVSHLSSDAGVLLALVPWLLCLACAACVAAALSRLPCVLCPWCLGCPACWCPGCCAVWVGCAPGALASWPALCWWAVCALCMGLPCGLSGWALFSGPLLWSPWRGF